MDRLPLKLMKGMAAEVDSCLCLSLAGDHYGGWKPAGSGGHDPRPQDYEEEEDQTFTQVQDMQWIKYGLPLALLSLCDLLCDVTSCPHCVLGGSHS